MRRALIGFIAGLFAAALGSQAAAEAKTCKLNRVAELPVTMTPGLRAEVKVAVNGVPTTLMVDTGAFFSMLTPEAARRLSLSVRPSPIPYITGVGGEVRVDAATVKTLAVGDMALQRVDFLVGGSEGLFGPGLSGILGQNLLRITAVEYDFANGAIRLFESSGCGTTPLVYWSDSFAVVDIGATTPAAPHIKAVVTVNGQRLRANFDTGSPLSLLSSWAAARAGLKPDGPGVTDGGRTGGLGRRTMESWIGPVESFGIGEETVKNTRIRFGDVKLQDTDMLLGADFFLSHRVLVSFEQRKLYATYNGGPVFRLNRAAAPAETDGSSAGDPTQGPAAAEPKDADGFARRAAAFAARRDFARAVQDYNRAVELEPGVANHLYDRALAHLAAGQGVLGMADLDQALVLKPDYPAALLARGRLYLLASDEGRAKADFDAAMRSAPVEANVELAVAETYQTTRRYEPAVAHYTHWIEAHPKAPGLAKVLNNRCWARALWGRELEAALADCDAAVRLERIPQILDSRGLVKLRLGRYDEAIADFDAALKQQPKLVTSLYGRGLAKLKSGRATEGQADLAAATALEPAVADRAKAAGLTP